MKTGTVKKTLDLHNYCLLFKLFKDGELIVGKVSLGR